MDAKEYNRISLELQELSKTIPLNWGRIQNNYTDAKLNLFYIKNKDQLENQIKNLKEEDQLYFRRRWFIWQCSRVDEYLFYKNDTIKQNPNSKDKNWDIEFNNNPKLRFDLKGTVVPKSMRTNFDTTNEKELINFYFMNQSKGIRYNIQNRLFIVHHSNYKNERSLFLRCHWELKEKASESFNKLVSQKITFIPFKNAISKYFYSGK